MMQALRISLSVCAFAILAGCGPSSTSAPSTTGSELEQFLEENPDISAGEYEEEVLE